MQDFQTENLKIKTYIADRGDTTFSKLGAQLTLQPKKVGEQNLQFLNLRLKKWVRKCAPCALGCAAPGLSKEVCNSFLIQGA